MNPSLNLFCMRETSQLCNYCDFRNINLTEDYPDQSKFYLKTVIIGTCG